MSTGGSFIALATHSAAGSTAARSTGSTTACFGSAPATPASLAALTSAIATSAHAGCATRSRYRSAPVTAFASDGTGSGSASDA
jgi:hypothetical protein|nr:hypothetical protein Q903MT_gene5111 [Picea sitchensis]